MFNKKKKEFTIGRIIVTLDPEKAIKSKGGYLIMYNGAPKEILNLEFQYSLFDGELPNYIGYNHSDYITDSLYKLNGTEGIKTVDIKYTV